MAVLLIHPPLAKACEPPAGIARLAGGLRSAGIDCRLLDANLEGQLALLGKPLTTEDTWSRRAVKHRDAHLAALRTRESYRHPDRYRRAVSDLGRLLELGGLPWQAQVGLADFQQDGLSPVRSGDLLAAAAAPERNPFHGWFAARLPELLAGVEIVGLSLNYLSQALTSFALLGWLRREHPRLRLVLGGGLVTSWLQRPDWRNPFGSLVDELVAGPGEERLLALCGGKQPASCAPPDYRDLPLADYLAPGMILPYSAASGCWWNRCSFCPERAEGNRYHPLPITRVRDELQNLIDRHHPVLLHLLDNAVSPELLRSLAARPPGIPWYGFARVDKQLADPAFCRALRASGCVMLKLGLETGDQQVLDALHKGLDLATVERALESLRQAGIAVYGYLLFGTPAEDAMAARRTLEFAVRNHSALSFLNIALFNMPLFGEEAEQFGGDPFYAGDLSLYTDFAHPRGWQRGEVRRFLSREFNRHPAIAAILRRDPPVFTSNHAPLFVP